MSDFDAPNHPDENAADSGSGNGNGGGGGERNTVMLVLSYVWLLCLVPLFSEKEDEEVQWNAKQGTVLFGLAIAIYIVLFVLSLAAATLGPLACLCVPMYIVVPVGLLVVHILAIVRALNGERLVLPVISDIAEKL